MGKAPWKSSILLYCLLASLCAFALAPPLPAYTIDTSFQKALGRSEKLALDEESVRQAEAREDLSSAPYWPSLSLQSNYLRQESIDSPLAQNISPDVQRTSRARLSQNLFRGFRDQATQTQRFHETAEAQASRSQTWEQLYLDVARAFFDVLAFRAEIADYGNEAEVLQQRHQELVKLRKLARARDVDLLTLDVSRASLDAARSLSEGKLRAALERFSYLTGLDDKALLEDRDSLPLQLAPLDTYLRQANERPELLMAQDSLQASEAAIIALRADYYPSLDFDAQYYFQRPGIYADSRWDFLLSANLNLFNGGQTRSRMHEVLSLKRSREIQIELIKRRFAFDIRSLHQLLETAFDQLKKLERAQELARRNYELMRTDSRLGLVSNIELLQVLSNYYSLRRGTEQVRYNIKFDLRRLDLLSAQKDLTNLTSRRPESE